MKLCDGARSALFLNILTEDNLPHYYRQINGKFGNDDVWGEWNRRWTAEEGRHAIVIRDYLAVTRSVDMRALERARMRQVSMGQVPNPDTIADGIVYVALQELATRISHRNTGKLLNDPQGAAIMSRVAADENLHHLFYRDLVSAALEIDPSGMVAAIERQVRSFEMPGAGIEDFKTHARVVADAGVYDFAVAPRPDPRAGRVQALARRAAAEPEVGGRAGAGAPGEARREGRQRRQAHEVAPGAASRAGLTVEPGSALAQAVALLQRVPLELHEPALDDPVVRPRHRRSADDGERAQQRRPQLELPRQPGLGAAVDRPQLQAGRSLQVAVDGGDEPLVAHRVVDPHRAVQLVRQRCLDHDPRGAAGRQRRPGSSVTPRSRRRGERAQPRPPLAVAIGVRERRPELRRGDAEVPRPVEAER